jgi:formate dehydrogenase accessory protein FdhD
MRVMLQVEIVKVDVQSKKTRATAIDSGIEIAQKAGVTLIGFARDNRMNVYSIANRVSV